MDSDKARELEELRRAASTLENSVRMQREALRKDGQIGDLKSLGKRSAAEAARTDSDPSAFDDQQEERLEQLREESAELAKHRSELERQLAQLHALQQTADRTQPRMVTLANLHAKDMQDYFDKYGTAQVDHRSSLPAAFVTECMGSTLQTPGSVRLTQPAAEDPDVALRALHAQREQLRAAQSVAFEHIRSMSQVVMACEKGGNFHVPPSEKISCPEMEEQMIVPVGSLLACSNAGNCVAMTELPPHPSINARLALKQMQRPSAFKAFKHSGYCPDSGTLASIAGWCLPCMLMSYARAAYATMQTGAACSTIAFPLDTVVERPGGFKRGAIVPSDTMPVSWPMLCAHHFVPTEKTLTYSVVDPRTGRSEKRTEKVFGYKFRADVLFDETVYSCGAEPHPAIPMRMPLIVTTKTVDEPELPVVLLDDAKVALAIEMDYSATLPTALAELIVELETTIRKCLSTDDEFNERRRADLAPYWNRSLLQAPAGLLTNTGLWSPRTHSVVASVMWRVGMGLFLNSRPELCGNVNVHGFLNAHTELQKRLFDAWVQLGAPPSDKQLVGDDVAVLTPESICAVLSMRGLYPYYPVPFLSPAQQREVRVVLSHRLRTPSLEHVRRAVLPKALLADGAPPRARARAALAWLAERAPVAAGTVVSTADSDSDPRHRLWCSRAITVIALQSDFRDSVWLLGAVAERWPWFQRIAADITGGVPLVPADNNASLALAEGRWLATVDEDAPSARLPGVPPDAPTWMRNLRGTRRFTVTYSRCFESAEDVRLGDHLYPDTLANLHCHASGYLVLAALRIRVHALQRLAGENDPSLRSAFDRMMRRSHEEGRQAAEPLRHDRRDVASRITSMILDPDMRPTCNINARLRPGASIMDVAAKVLDRWPEPEPIAREALEIDATLVESVAATEIGPMMDPAFVPPHHEWFMGVPPEARNVGYDVRCALFECLELAYQAVYNAPDGSDAHWFATEPDSRLRRLDRYGPHAGSVACEDTLPDTAQYVGLDLLHEATRPDFTSDIAARRSWIPHMSDALPKACYIRDWLDNHAQSCRHSEYTAASAQILLASVQGTYRHACTTQDFGRVLELYQHLRPQNSHTAEGRQRMARCLIRNTYKMLIAAREFQMLSILTAVSQRDVIAAAWPNFPYVLRCWVPQQAERMRVHVRVAVSEAASERAVREMARDEAARDRDSDDGPVATESDRLVPRVFRHMPQDWPHMMLRLFCGVENNHHVNAKLEQLNCGGIANLLPPIVNMVPPEIKHGLVRAFSQTDPRGPIRLDWFRSSGVSEKGLAELVLMNALYVAQARPRWICDLLAKMSRVDFVYAWTAMHIMVLHRDSLVLPVPWEMARRQYVAAQYRANDMVNPPPAVFTHIRFCHPLGCAGVQSYVTPFEDNAHYGAEDMTAIDLGRITCGAHRSAHMFDKLVRRMHETPVREMAAELMATMTALEATTNQAERQQLELDLQRMRDKLTTHQSTNVRATISVMMTRPCNEAPAQDLRTVGAMVVRFNRIHARERPRVYTACPNCGAPTIYSLDRFGPNGFMCGNCNREMRWAEHGRWCISCGFVEQAESLPQLTAEAEAIARASRTEKQIQGSTQQAHSLKAHLARVRHDSLVKRSQMQGEVKHTVDLEGKERDLSDTLQAPERSQELESVVIRREARASKAPTQRKMNTATMLMLGRSLSTVHPMPLKTRMEPFLSRVFYDDRAGGAASAFSAAICQPCAGRIRVPTLSLTNVLTQTHADPDVIWVKGTRVYMGGKRQPWRYNMTAALRASRAQQKEKPARANNEPVHWLSIGETQQLLKPA